MSILSLCINLSAQLCAISPYKSSRYRHFSIIFYFMEFLYAAVSGEGNALKGKMSKWRHLQVVCTQLLLIGLLFFLILQNGQLKKEVSSKLSHEFVQDIFNEKISQLSKDMEEIKMLLIETSKQNIVQHLETKKIIRILFNQLGLPISTPQKNTQTDKYSHRQEFEVVQLSQNQIQLQRNSCCAQEGDEQQVSIQQKEYSQSQRVELEQIGQENTTKQTCSYYQYLKQNAMSKNAVVIKKLKIRPRKTDNLQKRKFKAYADQIQHKDSEIAISPLRFRFSLFVIFGLVILVISLCVGKACRSASWNNKVGTAVRLLCSASKGGKKGCFAARQK